MTDAVDNSACYVAKGPCGCYLYACVSETARPEDFIEMARMVKMGFVIEPKTVQWVRDGGLNFHCPHRKKRRARVSSDPRAGG